MTKSAKTPGLVRQQIASLSPSQRNILLFAGMGLLLIIVGIVQSWNVAFSILNMCLISAIMALGVNIQWGYAGLFNVGIMGFAALGGLAAVVVSMPPVEAAWAAGGLGVVAGLSIGIVSLIVSMLVWRRSQGWGRWRYAVTGGVVVAGYVLMRMLIDPSTMAIEAVDSARTGYLGGLGLPIMLSWVVGGLFAAAAAWVVGKISLGLRADYLAIATLGISEIIIYVLKFEDWLSRGVKNVNGLPRPVPYEVDLQNNSWFVALAEDLNLPLVDASSLVVKICYALLFTVVLLAILWLSETALRSPWGRMMRAIRDNETSAAVSGVNLAITKTLSFGVASALGGVGGAIYVAEIGIASPDDFSSLVAIYLIVGLVVGGVGTLEGAVIGGLVYALVPDWASSTQSIAFVPERWLQGPIGSLILGIMLILLTLFMPGGIANAFKRAKGKVIQIKDPSY